MNKSQNYFGLQLPLSNLAANAWPYNLYPLFPSNSSTCAHRSEDTVNGYTKSDRIILRLDFDLGSPIRQIISLIN